MEVSNPVIATKDVGTATAFKRLTPRTRIIVIASSILLTGVVLAFLFVRAGTDLNVPIQYHDDALTTVAVFKGIGEGNAPWLNSRLAAPFGGDWRDFPAYQWIDYALFKLLTIFSGNYILILNLYWFLTVLFTAAAAAYSFLRLRISPALAVCLAFLYATQPFVFVRNITHFVLVCYLVPLLATACLEVALGRWDNTGRFHLQQIPLYAWVAFVLQGLSFFYFSFFGGLLLLAAAVFGTCARRTVRAMLQTAVLLTALLVSSLVGITPTLVDWARNGPNPAPMERSAAQAEANGLKIRHLLTPVPQHVVPFMRQLAERAAAAHPEVTEALGARLGSLAGIGFIGLSLYGLALLSGWRLPQDDGTIRACSALLLVAVMWCTVGGFGSVFNTFITAAVRGYARVIVFLVFFILASYGTVASGILKTAWVRANPTLALVALIGLTGASFIDALWVVPQTPEVRQQAARDRQFVAEVERALGGKGMVFQIPDTGSPGGSGPGKMAAFDHLRAYVQSSSLQWSWGTIVGRKESRWAQSVSQLVPVDMVSELARKGFRGVWMDTFGFADPGSVADALTAATGRQPLVSSDRRYLFFALDPTRNYPLPTPAENLPGELTILPLRSISKCNIDLANNAPIPGPTLGLLRSVSLRLSGWVGNTDTGVALPEVYLELTQTNSKHFYLQGVRTDRPDVQMAFHEPLLLRSGFSISGNLSTLPPGIYRVRLLDFGANDAQACEVGLSFELQ
jgi:phosphoglycerol transferase